MKGIGTQNKLSNFYHEVGPDYYVALKIHNKIC